MSGAIRPGWQSPRRFFGYAALLMLAPLVTSWTAFALCHAGEPATDEGHSLCGIVFIVWPPLAIGVVLALCAIYEVAVRLALRRAQPRSIVEQPRWRRYWFEAVCAVVAVAVATTTLLMIRPWEDESRHQEQFRQILARVEDSDQEVETLDSDGKGWPPANATFAEAKRYAGSGNYHLRWLFRRLAPHTAKDLPELRCLYWPVVEQGVAVSDAEMLAEKCWRTDRPHAAQWSHTYASLVD